MNVNISGQIISINKIFAYFLISLPNILKYKGENSKFTVENPDRHHLNQDYHP